MPGAFLDDAVVLLDIERSEIAERLFEHFARIEIFDLGRPTGFVLKLLRRVALQQEKPVWL